MNLKMQMRPNHCNSDGVYAVKKCYRASAGEENFKGGTGL